MDSLTIGQLGRATDTKIETIRYYEKIGLLPEPRRTSGNYRSYAAEHLQRLGFIRRARELGFSIEDVRELLKLAARGERPLPRGGPARSAPSRDNRAKDRGADPAAT
jgi:DNA-binding transcriptional MerR regulator